MLHKFFGDRKATLRGFGATYTTGKNSFLYVDVERSLGGGLKPTREVNLGVNYLYH